MVSVPYRGATFLNLNTKNLVDIFCSRFRPLSGSYISQYYEHGIREADVTKFPSPIGELHFSILYRKPWLHHLLSFRPLSGSYISQCFFLYLQPMQSAFPSPIGELHFSIIHFVSLSINVLWQFPSPIGELHFSIRFLNQFPCSFHVSVPYRGATFLNEHIRICTDFPLYRFRPLSGSYISQF